MTALDTPRLGRLARETRRPAGPAPALETCELCSEPVPPEHRHLWDGRRAALLCVCRACSLLFDRRAAGGGHYRLVPDRRLALPRLDLPDEIWHRLRVPVVVAFFVPAADGALARYPSPLGATVARPEAAAWAELLARNPALATLEDEVEAFLVRRPAGEGPGTGGAVEGWIVPVDDAFALVGEVRRRWRGLSGGTEVWERIDDFFAALRRRAHPASDDARREEVTA